MTAKRAYRLSPMAEADLQDIWLYTFKNWSEEQADSYHTGIIAAFAGLASGRKKGRGVDIREGYLKYAVGSHVVFYRMTSAGIDVIRVLRQSMDVKRHL
jgi:toxin ParE1/3/4